MTHTDMPTPWELLRLADSHGFREIHQSPVEGLYVLDSPKERYRQLIFPVYADDPRYPDMCALSLEKIAHVAGISVQALLLSVGPAELAALSVRYYGDEAARVDSLSLEGAILALDATRQLILSAACTSQQPRLYYPKLTLGHAESMARRMHMRHTQQGSFILRVAYLIQQDGTAVHPEYIGRESPMRALEQEEIALLSFGIVQENAEEIATHLRTGTADQLWEREKKAKNPTLSFNFLDALCNLYEASTRQFPGHEERLWQSDQRKAQLPFDLGTSKEGADQKRVDFAVERQADLLHLRGLFPSANPIEEGTFEGTVESLSGDFQQDQREGEVILYLKVGKRFLYVRAMLQARDYERALNSHADANTGVRVRGVLQEGTRMRYLDKITLFEIIESSKTRRRK